MAPALSSEAAVSHLPLLHDGDKETTRSRRPHRKSRQGCRRCKMRHIKCDEARPVCENCLRKGVSCDYPDGTSSLSLQPRERVEIPRLRRHTRRMPSALPSPLHEPISPSDGSITSHSSIANAVGTPADRFLELRLFHHYHKMASQSSSHAQNAWSTWVAGLAVRTPSLMDAVLGFSAFHLRHLNISEQGILEASHAYMARAIRSHMHELHEGINEDNAAATIAGCALILFHTSVNWSFLDGVEAGHRLPLHWFRPFQGAGAFFLTVWPWIQNTSIGHLLGSSLSATWQLRPQGRPPGRFDFLLHNLDPEGLLDGETLSAYRLAITHLSHIYSSPQYHSILRFPAQVSTRLIELLAAQDPRALAIAGYFFMLLKIADPIWWVEGAPEREFSAIMAFLPSSWWPLMDWAVREFRWNPDGKPRNAV